MLRYGKTLCGFSFLVVALAVRCQTVTFSTTTFPSNNLWNVNLGPNGHVRADLNGDGREDFISDNNASWSSDCAGSFAVSLSTGDGAYAAPVCYTVPNGYAQFFAIGDFYGTGSLDVAVTSTANALYLYKNDGRGNLSLALTMTLPEVATGIAAADVNHDGKIDLVYDLTDPSALVQAP
jgi:FG-GAP-like repeat